MTSPSVLVGYKGWWVHPNWLQPAFNAVMARWKSGKRPAMVRTPRIVEPTLASLRATGQ